MYLVLILSDTKKKCDQQPKAILILRVTTMRTSFDVIFFTFLFVIGNGYLLAIRSAVPLRISFYYCQPKL